MAASWLTKGREAVHNAAEEIQRIREEAQSKSVMFKLKDNESALVRFIDDLGENVPAVFSIHRLDRLSSTGKRFQEQVVCWGVEECPFCKAGLKKTKQVAYRIIDRRLYETVKENGKDVIKVKGMASSGGSIRLLQRWLDFAQIVDNFYIERTTLLDRDYKVERKGSGFETAYTLIDKDPKPLTAEDKKLIAEASSIEDMLKPLSFEEAMKKLGKIVETSSDEDKSESTESVLTKW